MAFSTVKKLAAAGASAVVIASALLFGTGGLEGNSNAAYKDIGGVATICGGVTQGVYIGMYKSDEECDELNDDALETADQTLQRCAPGVDMTEPEKAAWISFIYNVGPGRAGVKDGFCVLHDGRIPTLLSDLRANDHVGACNELDQWVYAAGRKVDGLVVRRQQEKELCLTKPGASASPVSLLPSLYSPVFVAGVSIPAGMSTVNDGLLSTTNIAYNSLSNIKMLPVRPLALNNKRTKR